MLSITVIADDLTGSLDTAVHFSRHGLGTVVVDTGQARRFLSHRDHDAVVVNTESRHLAAADALSRVVDAVSTIAVLPDVLVYKKTDSTLRGNIGAEFGALLQTWPHKLIVFAPALPAQGRRTRNGIHFIGDTTIEKTGFANDPVNPIDDPFIPNLLKRQTDATVSLCTPDTLAGCIRSAVRSPAATAGRILVVDADDEQDLDRVAAVCAADLRHVIPAGSAGLAAHLLTHWVGPAVPAAAVRPSDRTPSPRLFVSGSLNPVALRQTADALSLGLTDVPVDPEVAALLGTTRLDTPEVDAVVALVVRALDAGRDVCLRTVLDRDQVAAWRARFEAATADTRPIHTALPAAYGELIGRVIRRSRVGTMVVFGGDTVHGIITSLSVESITPIAEVLPGVVWSHIEVDGIRMNLITKAGGFDSTTNLVAELFENTSHSSREERTT